MTNTRSSARIEIHGGVLSGGDKRMSLLLRLTDGTELSWHLTAEEWHKVTVGGSVRDVQARMVSRSAESVEVGRQHAVVERPTAIHYTDPALRFAFALVDLQFVSRDEPNVRSHAAIDARGKRDGVLFGAWAAGFGREPRDVRLAVLEEIYDAESDEPAPRQRSVDDVAWMEWYIALVNRIADRLAKLANEC